MMIDDIKSSLLTDNDTLASNELESMDRITLKNYRLNYIWSPLRPLWRLYYKIKSKIDIEEFSWEEDA